MTNHIYDYCLTPEERKYLRFDSTTPAYLYLHSEGINHFTRGVGKIHMFLHLSEKIKEMEFSEKEQEDFANSIRTHFTTGYLRIKTLKSYTIEGLIEQSIVIMVSIIEQYFSTIIEIILNDGEFINKKKENQDFLRFLKYFQLISEDSNEENQRMLKDFGTYVISSKKVNFQQLQNINKTLKYLFQIDIHNLPDSIYDFGSKIDYEVKPNDWDEFHKLFAARHMIIHGTNRNISNIKMFAPEVKYGFTTINQIYTIEKLNNLKIRFEKILQKIDERLFTSYEREYLQ